ncbi:MAG: 50S ribosomal protein L15 [Thermoplasmata archaeon]|nr:MAG: 50S ribosomal protein L15 [Thermoplasmata archaeon]
MVRDRTKKRRGSRTHGHGKDKPRGAGNRGGRGRAGSFNHKFIYYWKYERETLGKYGWPARPGRLIREIKTINVGDLDHLFPDKEEINLKELGYDKLLGGGKITRPIKVIVPAATPLAKKKVEEAGGVVIENA